MYFVYVLESLIDGKHYTGITNNLERRLKQHDRGSSGTPSTKKRGPFYVIYYERVQDRRIAREREKYLKSGVGREFIKIIQRGE